MKIKNTPLVISDPFLHCVVACRAAQECGEKLARSYWDARDQPGGEDWKEENQLDSEKDLANNAVGYKISGDCWKGCLDAWKESKLQCLDTQGKFYPCNVSSIPEHLDELSRGQ